MNAYIKSLYLGLLPCFMWGSSLGVKAQDDVPASDVKQEWRIKGFVDTYHALGVNQSGRWMSSRTRLRGELARDVGKATLFTSFNAVYNALLPSHTGFELREAYLDYHDTHWSMRAGRQLILWGVADAVRITDLIAPMDYTEFLAQDYDDIRMPVNALRLGFFNEKVRLDLVAVPTFTPFRLPIDTSNPWSVLPEGVVWQGGNQPALRLSNVEYGGRMSFTLPSLDFSLSALHTWGKMPVISYAQGVKGLVATPHYYRMGVLGIDFSKPLGLVVLRGEGACLLDKHFSYRTDAQMTPQQGFTSLSGLIGVDWYAPHQWTVMAQVSAERILGHKAYVAQRATTTLVTLSLTKKLMNDQLALSDFTYWDVTGQGWFSRFSADYALTDEIHLMLGFDLLGAESSSSLFYPYRRNSELWLKAKYSF